MVPVKNGLGDGETSVAGVAGGTARGARGAVLSVSAHTRAATQPRNVQPSKMLSQTMASLLRWLRWWAMLHHQRKLDAADPFDTVSGTLGLTGATDSILILSKTLLQGRGRDLPQFANAVAFDRETCRWTIIGDADELRTSNERQAIIDAMREIGAPASPSQIARQSRVRSENVSKLLQKMARDGQVLRNGYGSYVLAAAREGGPSGGLGV
jgi:hypothetical protein